MDKPEGIGGLLMTKAEHGSYYYMYNHLGSVQKVVNRLGVEIENYLYTPYGVSSGSQHEHQPFGYSTKRSDFKSGLVYFGYRFYVPNFNRDPLEELGGMNLYAHVNGDPLGYVDPDGRMPTVIAIGIGVGLDYAVQGVNHYRNTGNWISWGCVDKTDLFWSGLFSATAPSLLASTKKIYQGLGKGTSAGRNVAKSHLELQATWQGSKQLHKKASNVDGGSCECN
ncbi:RHS repeat domain-containing protein [Vibrio sp. TRT 21S02]|uniref:RHS repeat domain-containing protein n=1 Tax=Vibrio sp. TRT 21S02 TaxID=3418507 RepID=UPI003CEFE702